MKKIIKKDLSSSNTNSEEFSYIPSCLHMINQNLPWEEVLHLGRRQIIPMNSLLPAQNTAIFYYIRHGSIRLERIGISGDEKYLSLFLEGCIFNEIISIIYPAQPHSDPDAYFRAIDECEVYIFKASLLSDLEFIAKYPHLMHNILKSTAKKASLFMRNLSNANIINPTARVCRFLHNAHMQINEQQVGIPMVTQVELAKFLGLSRSNLGRIIFFLRQEKILGAFTKTRLEILDCVRLLELSEMP